MPFDRMLAELFKDEDRAREMASRLMQLAQTSPGDCIAERNGLIEFVRGPMERHMSYEERAVFPQLTRRGLAPEVQVAQKQHASIRQAAELLTAVSERDLPRVIFDTARLLLHHTNFECDYIYPELTHQAWIELMQETMHEDAGGGGVSTEPIPAT